ncbi:MAG: lysozyme [Proteobacteria bacterium]|nr:lysozyme [Pseudomonadota bacterium]
MTENAPDPMTRDVCRTGRSGRQRAVLLGFGLGGIFVVISIVAAAAGWWAPSADRYVQGVDVSAHQGHIDWDALARAGVRFAYIKSSEGASFVDPRFSANWRDAGRAGLRRGAYHRFTLCRSAAGQAANFIRTVPRAGDALPPAVDVENFQDCASQTAVAQIEEFLDTVEAHYGARPILYVTRQFHDAHQRDFPHERFWIRSLYAPPEFGRADWVIWQHHNNATRPGIEAPVDLDAFRGDEAALARFARNREPTT